MTLTQETLGARPSVAPFAKKRHRPGDVVFHAVVLGAVIVAISSLIWVMWSIVKVGVPLIDWDFLAVNNGARPKTAGFTSALRGSLVVLLITMLVALPLGFGAAIYLEKFAVARQQVAARRAVLLRDRLANERGLARVGTSVRLIWARLVGPLNRFVDINISNLAAVPSVIYGLLGLAVFVTFAGLSESLLAGGLTLAMLVLPIIIISSREALKAVPSSIEQGALALGSTPWQAVRGQVVPAAIPGMLTGSILAMSRAIGESAPLIVVGGVVFSTHIPSVNPVNAGSEALLAMPLQIFFWAARPQESFRDLAAAGIVVLMIVLLLMNSVAIFLRNRYSKRW
jgi:phosphate transport system permease protein